MLQLVQLLLLFVLPRRRQQERGVVVAVDRENLVYKSLAKRLPLLNATASDSPTPTPLPTVDQVLSVVFGTVLGTRTLYDVTERACELFTQFMALGEEPYPSWNPNMGIAECIFISEIQDEGACVLPNGRCNFGFASEGAYC